MEALFLQLTRMSLTAGWMILAVLLVRPLLKKAPRSLMCLLWGLASLRLLIPVTIKSRVSLVPTAAALPEGIQWAAPIAAPMPQQTAAAVQEAALSPTGVLSWIWISGTLLMAGYALFSYCRLRRQVCISMPAGKRIYLCDNIPSPFILGILQPRIYIPSSLTEQQTRFVLAHEQAHLRRGDHLWKPLGYLLLCIYWFHPLCWVAYLLFCRDMELACDERVVHTMERQERSAYSHTLLECSIRGRMISACPLAFGEVGVKDRVRNVLSYRKPAAWIVAASCLVSAILACCFLTDPVQAAPYQTDGAACILIEPAELRDAPNGKVLATLDTASQASFQMGQNLSDSGQWAQIYCPDLDTLGWVETSKLAFPTACRPLDVTSATHQPLFLAPNVSSRILGELKPGEEFRIEQQAAGGTDQFWFYVTCQERQISGWLPLDSFTTETDTKLPSKQGVFGMAVSTANVYSAPSPRGKIVQVLNLGDTVPILRWETVDNTLWYCIRLDGTNTLGWVEADCLTQAASMDAEVITDPSAAPAESVQSILSSTEIRSAPSEQARIISTLESGSTVSVLRQETVSNTVWCYIRCGSSSAAGWVKADCLHAETQTAHHAETQTAHHEEHSHHDGH